MKQWYLFNSKVDTKLLQPVREMQNSKMHQLGAEFPTQFAFVPRGHHIKENYDFGFATVKHEIYDKQEFEDALSKNVTDLLLELGTGFKFIGQ